MATSPISETMSSMKQVLSPFDYRRFLFALYRTAWHLVKSNGQSSKYSNVDTTCDICVEVMSQTDLAKQLVLMLGFEKTLQFEGILYMVDYNRHQSSLRILCDLAEPELLVTKGDPAADLPPPDAGNVIHVVAYLSYHLYMRLLIVLHCTRSPLLYTLEDKIIRSFELAEEASSRLGVMQPGFGVREVWDDCKQTFLRHVSTLDGDEDISPIEKCMTETIDMINEEVEAKYPSTVHGVMSYLQNIQALMKMTFNAQPIPPHAFPIYRRNKGRFPQQYLSNEYRVSMDGVQALMDIASQRGLTSEEREQLYRRLAWQSENFLSNFKTDVSLEAQEEMVETRPVNEEARIAMMKETMESLKRNVGPLKYRAFVRVISIAVSRAVESEADEATMHINTSERTFATVSGISRHASRLIWTLGYEDCFCCPLPVLRNFSQHQATLKAFLTAASESVDVIVGDPARHTSVDEIGGKAALVAHLVYHYRLRCFLLTANTCQQLLGSIEPEIRVSMAAVDAITARLGVARPDSLQRRIWENLKRDIGKYLLTGDTGGDRGSLMASFENLDSLLVADMVTTGCPPNAVHLLPVTQNIATTIIVTTDGQMLIGEHAQTYLVSSGKIPPTAFSPDYMAVLKTLRELMQKSIIQRLSDDEISRINDLSIWQVNNFLTQLRPLGLEGGAEHFAFTSMAADMGLDLSEIWTAFQAGVPPEDMAMEATRRQLQRPTEVQLQQQVSSPEESDATSNSDGEEKVDESEKPVKDKDHERTQDKVENNHASSLPVPSHEAIPEAQFESTVTSLLTSDVTSDDFLQRVCCNLKTPEELRAAVSGLESTSRAAEASKRQLQNEMSELRKFADQQEPGVVLDTVMKAITDNERKMEDVRGRLVRASRACEFVRGLLVHPRRLKDLEGTDITSYLLSIVTTSRLSQEDIPRLIRTIADSIPLRDLLQEHQQGN